MSFNFSLLECLLTKIKSIKKKTLWVSSFPFIEEKLFWNKACECVLSRLGPWERKDKLLKRKDELLPSIRFFFIFRSKFIVSKRRDAETMREFFSSAWLNLFFKLRDNHKRYGFTYWLKNVAHKNLHNICYINII